MHIYWKFLFILFLGITPFFNFRNLAKMKDTTGTACQRNSSETAQQNFVKLFSYEGHNLYMRISTGNFYSFFFRSYALFELRNLAKMKDTTQHSLLAQLL